MYQEEVPGIVTEYQAVPEEYYLEKEEAVEGIATDQTPPKYSTTTKYIETGTSGHFVKVVYM